MTKIPAVVIAAQELAGHQYHVIVHIGVAKYRGSFATLAFGENKPITGTCHDRRLDLLYPQDPQFYTGQKFPLWST